MAAELMQPEIVRNCTFYEVGGEFGTDCVLASDIEGTFTEEPGPVPPALQPHCINTTCTYITKRFGYCCRMVGLEPTRWVGFRSRRLAAQYLLTTFGNGSRPWEKELQRCLKRK